MLKHFDLDTRLNLIPARLLVSIIKFYQVLLSPFFGTQCRFYPSCSHYAQEAIMVHGCLRGSYLGLLRICRCNPLCDGGNDPVPSINSESQQ